MAAELGVYVHIPFCARRCDYCDFATWTDRGHLVDEYVDACRVDLERRTPAPATSVFFGGGTPSLIPADALVRILAAIPRAPGAEVTVECNPDSVDQDKLTRYAAAGVNRVSFGVQSMRPHVLRELGRTHDPDNVAAAVESARAAGIEQVSLDLIYGSAGESVADWEATLDLALELEPDHVSAYALTVEAGAPLAGLVASGERRGPDDDDQATKYEVADERLTAAGYPWYEISNWARPGRECRHNLLYWGQGEYLAIGCSAHGHTRADPGCAWVSRRWWNVRTPERYIRAIAGGESPEGGAEELDAATASEEQLVLALRTRAGIDVAALGDLLEELLDDGLVTRSDDRATLTRRGRLLANDVAVRLLMNRERARPAVVSIGTR